LVEAAMQKILFTEFAELRQGDGKGPKYFAGKAYWLTPDQAERWKTEGVAQDAPADMAAENEEDNGPAPLRPEHIRIVRTKGSRYNVTGPNDHKFNDEPLTAAGAELLRKAILDGKVVMPQPEPTLLDPPAADQPQPVTFIERIEGGIKKVFVAADWPMKILIDDQMLSDQGQNDILTLVGDHLDISVANGFATYHLDPADEQGRHKGELISGTFEAPPVAP
jgi:hypothetical protein